MGRQTPGSTSRRAAGALTCLLAGLLVALALPGCEYGPAHEAGACTFGPPCGAQAGAGGSAGPAVPAGPAQTGVGDAVLRLGDQVDTVRLQARSVSGGLASFRMSVNGRLVRALLVGEGATVPASDDVLRVAPGGVVEMRGAAVAWSIQAVQPMALQGAPVQVSGSGASVLRLPARPGRYELQVSYPGDIGALTVYADGDLVSSALVGRQQAPAAFRGQWLLPGGALLEVVAPAGAVWQLREVAN